MRILCGMKYFPREWKFARIHPLYKQGKLPTSKTGWMLGMSGPVYSQASACDPCLLCNVVCEWRAYMFVCETAAVLLRPCSEASVPMLCI